MGCDCTKFSTATKIVPVDQATNHTSPVLVDNAEKDQQSISRHGFIRQAAPVVGDDAQKNQDDIAVDEHIGQSDPTLLENINTTSTDELVKPEEHASVDISTNYPISISVNNPIKTFEQRSIHESISDHLSQRIDSGTSNKRSISAGSRREESHDHTDKLKGEIHSLSDKLIVEENTLNTTNNFVEIKTTDSIITEDLLSKRIDSGTSNKRVLSPHSDLLDDDIVSISDASVIEATISALPAAANDHVEIIDVDSEAFNPLFLKQRQDAIDNSSYRLTIESWSPNKLQQLSDIIRGLSKNKSLIDCHWIIFYWIACNIEYDVVSYLSDNIPSQSVDAVFRTRKGVCAGYSRLYKYLCDQLNIKCVEISGYAKGHGFDNRKEGAFLKTDHAWNAVEIEQHWYLIDATWGTGHLNKQNAFERKLNCFYFLVRPHQMIYDHLPEDDKWQLLREPINMTQYLQMPKVHPSYFNLNLELVSPRNQAHVTFVRDKSYALVLMRAPSDVDLIASLKLDRNKIDGGHRIVFDAEKQLYRCYFAPASTGKHKVTVFGKRVDAKTGSYEAAVCLTFNVNELPQNPVSYPESWKLFYELGLKVMSPVNTHFIKVCNGATHACITIRAPDDVQLIADLKNSDGKKIAGGEQVYYNQRKSLWKCKFAPDQNGLFTADIFGKKKSDTGNYSSVISFKIEAIQIPSPPLSYPHTWQLFHDLNLKVKAPQNCSTVPWPDNSSYVEILMQAPDDVQLSCSIHYNNVSVKNGTLVQFDTDTKLWQLLFAPERVGQHELIVFAKRNSEKNSQCALKFHLNVKQLQKPMKFPVVYETFHMTKGRIYEPIDGILKKGATVQIHCLIPGATDVNLQVDSKWLKAEGYQDPILKRKVIVGSKDVTIYGRYEQKSSYVGLVKYSVQ